MKDVSRMFYDKVAARLWSILKCYHYCCVVFRQVELLTHLLTACSTLYSLLNVTMTLWRTSSKLFGSLTDLKKRRNSRCRNRNAHVACENRSPTAMWSINLSYCCDLFCRYFFFTIKIEGLRNFRAFMMLHSENLNISVWCKCEVEIHDKLVIKEDAWHARFKLCSFHSFVYVFVNISFFKDELQTFHCGLGDE